MVTYSSLAKSFIKGDSCGTHLSERGSESGIRGGERRGNREEKETILMQQAIHSAILLYH